MSKDTHPEIEAEYRRRLMALEPGERAAMACRMFDDAKTIVLAGLKDRDSMSVGEIRVYLFERFYGRDFSDEEKKKSSPIFCVSRKTRVKTSSVSL